MRTLPEPHCLQSPAQNSQPNTKQLWAPVILDSEDMLEETRKAHYKDATKGHFSLNVSQETPRDSVRGPCAGEYFTPAG